MAANTNADLEELTAEIAQLKSDVAEIAQTISRLSVDLAAQGRDSFKDAAEQSRDKAREAVNGLEHEIRSRPLTSVATAFGVGFVLGKLLDR